MRGSDKELEREQYNQDHSSTRHLKDEIAQLKKENERLKKQLKNLKLKKACHETVVPLTDEQLAFFLDDK